MSSAHDYTDPCLAIFRRVPTVTDGVCRICRSGPNIGFDTCYSCTRTMGQVEFPTTQIIPISLYRLNEQLWHVLRNYKDGRVEVTSNLGIIVAATIARFTATHWSCIGRLLNGQPTVVTTVPSTRVPPRLGEHPLAKAVKRSTRLSQLFKPLLVRGQVQATHLQASDDAFRAPTPLYGEKVLLIEDTFTSGARTQSAASALRRAGADTVVVVVAGRVIDPDWNDNCRDIWEYATAEIFNFEECCICKEPS